MIAHDLKTWPAYFRPIWDGEKTFEIRYDDRGFQRGDVVILREWDRGNSCDCKSAHHADDCGRYTGRRVLAEIGYVTASTSARGQQPGFQGRGYVVFSLINAERVEAPTAEGRTDEQLVPGLTHHHYAPGGFIPKPRPPSS